MSLFRKPKKTIQRRVFSSGYGDDNEEESLSSNDYKMDVDIESKNSSEIFSKDKKIDKKIREKEKSSKNPSLLSFNDDEEGEIFQVKKSSHSKKVMKMLDKERRKKKTKDISGSHQTDQLSKSNVDLIQHEDRKKKGHNINISNNTQTEIRTDDFVLVVKKTEPENSILNGRAALCAGRDDMSSDEEQNNDENNSSRSPNHRFAKPDNFKTVLESGAIPDAAMIHAARKSRQKAREQGDFIPIDEKPIIDRKGRLIREDGDDDNSDEERVDMSAINGAKEKEERREIFYSVQQEYSGEDSDPELNEWENQQIRKGVTGAQLVTAQQESIYSQYMIKSSYVQQNEPMSTGNLLEQAYARNCLEKPLQMFQATQKQNTRISVPRAPEEIVKKMTDRLKQVKELHSKHLQDITEITESLQILKMGELECEQNVPIAAAKYRFYQELRGYVADLVECLDEKVPAIVELERKAIVCMLKHATLIIERRRQDVRDQTKEMAEAGKPGASKKMLDDEERVRRAADREGRRTRRRQIREKIDINNTHLDGMSSDDEIHQDHDATSYKFQLEQISCETKLLFEDVTEEFSEVSFILDKFEEWRKKDFTTYKDTYFSLSLPKILGPLIRLNLVNWNPLEENPTDLERMDWYNVVIKYGWSVYEAEDTLINDPDVRLIPVVIEKIILPKVTEIIETCWDPLSTTQTLKLVGLISRLGREYPSLKPTSKYLRSLFTAILDKMKLSLESDVFIPIFQKQMQEARSSFFQRQFSSGLKLFRNLLSFQGILSDIALKELAILSLLNRYLLSAMRVCTPVDATSKACIIVNTLPRVWLQTDSGVLESLQLFIVFLKHISTQLDSRNALHTNSIEKMAQVLHSLHESTLIE